MIYLDVADVGSRKIFLTWPMFPGLDLHSTYPEERIATAG